MKKRMLRFGVLLIVLSLCISICAFAATTSLSYWYAYDADGYQTSIGIYCTQPVVGKVIECQESSSIIAATALVMGIDAWNASDALPFSISYLYYNSSQAYTVGFQSGSREWLSSYFPGLSATASGKTEMGDLLHEGTASYNGSSKTIYSYSASSDLSGASITRIGVLNSVSTSVAEVIGAHELGHALGWDGHSNDSTQLMHTSANGFQNYTVGLKDKRHIAQFYNAFYSE